MLLYHILVYAIKYPQYIPIMVGFIRINLEFNMAN